MKGRGQVTARVFVVCVASTAIVFSHTLLGFLALHKSILHLLKSVWFCVFLKVSSHLGEQFLLQAETSNLLNEWYSTIQSAIDLAVS